MYHKRNEIFIGSQEQYGYNFSDCHKCRKANKPYSFPVQEWTREQTRILDLSEAQRFKLGRGKCVKSSAGKFRAGN